MSGVVSPITGLVLNAVSVPSKNKKYGLGLGAGNLSKTKAAEGSAAAAAELIDIASDSESDPDDEGLSESNPDGRSESDARSEAKGDTSAEADGAPEVGNGAKTVNEGGLNVGSVNALNIILKFTPFISFSFFSIILVAPVGNRSKQSPRLMHKLYHTDSINNNKWSLYFNSNYKLYF